MHMCVRKTMAHVCMCNFAEFEVCSVYSFVEQDDWGGGGVFGVKSFGDETSISIAQMGGHYFDLPTSCS